MKKSKKFKILFIITFVIILLFVTDLTVNASNNYVVGLTKGEEQDDADITYGIRITSSIIDLINENAEY